MFQKIEYGDNENGSDDELIAVRFSCIRGIGFESAVKLASRRFRTSDEEGRYASLLQEGEQACSFLGEQECTAIQTEEFSRIRPFLLSKSNAKDDTLSRKYLQRSQKNAF